MSSLRVLAASGDSMGHLSHAFVLLAGLHARRGVEGIIALPHDTPFASHVERHGYRRVGVGVSLGIRQELSARMFLRHGRTLVSTTVSALREADRTLRSECPDLVIGTGGRCSLPLVLTAARRGIPTLTVPHFDLRRTNRMLAYWVDRTCLARESDRGRFPFWIRPRLRVTGTPIRPEAFTPEPRASARARLGLPLDIGSLVAFIGYSRGSASFTRLAVATARALEAAGADTGVLLQHGEWPSAEERPSTLLLSRPFYEDVLTVFAAADLAVIAGGETTLLEASASGTPSICISLPDTPIGPHVFVLAREMEAEGALIVVPPAPLSGQALAETIQTVLTEPGHHARMVRAARGIADSNATARVLDAAESLLPVPTAPLVAAGA
jgi:UDP-N-acetylglucosamine--N-acetylmuramyl-(pentapeptide) pyrophosphoryl-undecaprenol N-acetylglucosamine transferase